MENRRENKLSRNLNVDTFFRANETVLVVGAPGLAGVLTRYRAVNTDLISRAQIINQDITGSSVEKNYLRSNMRDFAIAVSGAIHAHLILTNKFKEAEIAKLTKSEVDNARDSDAYVNCKHVYDKAIALGTALLDMGAPPAMLSDFAAALQAYFDFIQDSQQERGSKSAALDTYDNLMAESDMLLDVLKGIMLTQKAAHPEMYLQFINSTFIDDNNGGGGPSLPDYEFSIMPNQFLTALTIPYLSTRKFKAKNLSDFVIQWGLSELEGSFSNSPSALNDNTTSTLLSSTLGGSGNFLLFFNPTALTINIEITVIED